MGHINPDLAATNIESSRSNARTAAQRRILRITGHINPDLAATNAEYASIEPSILPLLAKSAPLFATFLAAVSRDSKTEAASLIQRVYRGHLGRNGAKSLA
jgi:hypothetical protein